MMQPAAHILAAVPCVGRDVSKMEK